MNTMRKVAVSSTLTDPAWPNTTVIGGDDVVGSVRRLRAETEGVLMVAGSATLVHTLLDHDLVDELRTMVFPVTIGSGVRLFSDTVRKTSWRLTDTQTFPTQVRVDRYVPA